MRRVEGIIKKILTLGMVCSVLFTEAAFAEAETEGAGSGQEAGTEEKLFSGSLAELLGGLLPALPAPEAVQTEDTQNPETVQTEDMQNPEPSQSEDTQNTEAVKTEDIQNRENVNYPEGADVIIQAHAGLGSMAPENTLAAFRLAWEIGADGFETDIRMTKDNRLVLHHDDAIDGTSSGSGKISGLTLEELKSFDFGSWYGEEYAGERILTLEECLEAAGELGFQSINLEMKPTRGEKDIFVKLMAEAIEQSGLKDRIMVSSFDPELLKALKDCAPDIRAAMITVPGLTFLSFFDLGKYFPEDKALTDFGPEDVKNIPGFLIMMMRGFGARGESPEEIALEVIDNLAAVIPTGLTLPEALELIGQEADLVGFIDSLDFEVDCLNCHYNSLSDALMEAMKERGIQVYAWTPDEDADLLKAFSFSPDGIITNKPERARELLENPSAVKALSEQEPAPERDSAEEKPSDRENSEENLPGRDSAEEEPSDPENSEGNLPEQESAAKEDAA